MNDVLAKLGKIGIVPVIALDDAKDALPLGKALLAGGIACAEVTFRTAAAEDVIRTLTKELPEMLTGAGTVLTTEQVDRAVAAGAKFIVSPGLNPKVVEYCVNKGIPVTPGCSSPSDIEVALEYGLEVVKFFPAEAAGGIAMIKAMSAPYGGVKFMPTGGINSGNINNYLSFNKVLACGGSWMVDKKLVAAGNFDEITRLSREAVETILGFEVVHVGVNLDSEDAASETADRYAKIFGFARKDGNSSIFAGSGVELMKSKYLGTMGHIAIRTNSIERAMYHLEQRGAKFNLDSAKRDEKGNLKAIYLDEEFGGFAVHLMQK
ncbi:MAG: bifunctional 4-hydroxy-2-oxoglutarate aldolase/2-dehydro-3-deoxy-phosphogluconate aldolase [Lachnospiraceae bacterium]|nr:bifunctional 4-hydroxy-2-oxoglutarate aldolase/2-dehydro-3-deoxy-phosphogluconate aldolase [Lachnospiraceae bacterium]